MNGMHGMVQNSFRGEWTGGNMASGSQGQFSGSQPLADGLEGAFRADDAKHIIWGGVENLNGSTSGDTGNSGTGSGSEQSSERTGKKKIKNRPMRTDEITMLSCSSNSTQGSGSAARQAEGSNLRQSSGGSQTAPTAPATGSQDLPSVGSALHESGRCKPCLFLHEVMGCKTAERCPFCHLPHNRRNIARQSKGKRDRFRKLVAKIEALGWDAPQEPLAVGRVDRPGEEEDEEEGDPPAEPGAASGSTARRPRGNRMSL